MTLYVNITQSFFSAQQRYNRKNLLPLEDITEQGRKTKHQMELTLQLGLEPRPRVVVWGLADKVIEEQRALCLCTNEDSQLLAML